MKFCATVLFLFIMLGCQRQSVEHFLQDDINKDYKEGLKLFDSVSIDHFPKKIFDANSTFLYSQDLSFSHPRIWLRTKCKIESLDSIRRAASKIALEQYSAGDSCLLVVDEHLTYNNRLNFDKTANSENFAKPEGPRCNKSYLPLPKFWDELMVETDETRIGLRSEYAMFVLDAKSGVFRDLQELPNGKFTHKGWEHGFTKGVGINSMDTLAIFWFDIW